MRVSLMISYVNKLKDKRKLKNYHMYTKIHKEKK